MQINITGDGMQITPPIHDYTNNKLSRLRRLDDSITSINVILSVEKVQQIAKATIHVSGAELHAESKAENLYSAIDELIDRLEQRVSRHKEKARERS